MRRDRNSGAPETKKAIAASHSHQFLWVPLSLETTVVRKLDCSGVVTSQISWCLQIVVAQQPHVLRFHPLPG
jgi:hypothetical protein